MADKRLVSRETRRVAAWDKRQPNDPTAAERMRRMRERRKTPGEGPESGPNGSDEPENGSDGVTNDPQQGDGVTAVTTVTDRNPVTTREDKTRTEEIPPTGGDPGGPPEVGVAVPGSIEAAVFQRGKA